LRVVSDQEFTKGNYAAALKNAFLGLDEDLKRRACAVLDGSGGPVARPLTLSPAMDARWPARIAAAARP